MALALSACASKAQPPGAPHDTDAALDTDVSVDSALVDTDVAGPEYFKVAMVLGRATVSPGALFAGTVERSVQVIQASALTAPKPPPLTVFCLLQYRTRQVRALETTSLCPSCEFGFELTVDARVDRMPTLYPGTFSDVEGCDDGFVAVGGLPQRLPNQKLFFSSTYGALYYQDTRGALVRYTDDVAFQSDGTLDYRKYLYRVAY